MISQTLLDRLLEMRLTVFRVGLREQAANPHYIDLPFEERLLLLADLECTRRSKTRLKRRLKLADFPLTVFSKVGRTNLINQDALRSDRFHHEDRRSDNAFITFMDKANCQNPPVIVLQYYQLQYPVHP